MTRMTIYLPRGTAEQHDTAPLNFIPLGNFTLVTDRPELRFHDGVTPGGLVIPIPREVLPAVRAFYAARDAAVNATKEIPKDTQ